MRNLIVGLGMMLLLPLGAQAQHWLEVQTGPVITGVNLEPNMRQNFEQNWQTGLWWQHRIGKHTGLHAGVTYITRSWHILPETDEEYQEETNEISLAMLTRVRIGGGKVGVALEAGPYMSYVQDRTVLIAPLELPAEPTVDFSQQTYNDLLFGLRGGIGPVYNPGRFQVQLLLSYELGLSDVFQPDISREGDFDISQPQTTLISLGLAYQLSRKKE